MSRRDQWKDSGLEDFLIRDIRTKNMIELKFRLNKQVISSSLLDGLATFFSKGVQSRLALFSAMIIRF